MENERMETAFRSDVRFTQDQFASWLDENGALLLGSCELLDGAIVMAPPAGYPHGDVTMSLAFALEVHVAAHGLGRVYESSMGFELPSGDTVEPDVTFLSEERFSKGPSPQPGKFLRMVPDLVIEVLSPSTAKRDRTDKKRIYARNGVSEYWLVHEPTRTVVVHSLSGEDFDEGTEYRDGRVRSTVLPGLELTVADVFARVVHTDPR